MIRVSAVVLSLVFSASAQSETTMRDVSSVLGQVNRIMGGSSTSNVPKAQYVQAGTRVRLDDGRIADVYGFECSPDEPKPCGSIKVDGSSHRVLVMPANGKPFEERWTFRRLKDRQLVFVRPRGQIVQAAL